MQLQVCFKQFQMAIFRDNFHQSKIETDIVKESTWSSWGPWKFDSNSSKEIQTRLCCGDRCHGNNQRQRDYRNQGMFLVY